MSDTIQLPPAGWHPDPIDDSQSRWWNGTGWTEQTAPKEQSALPSDFASDPLPSRRDLRQHSEVFDEPIVVDTRVMTAVAEPVYAPAEPVYVPAEPVYVEPAYVPAEPAYVPAEPAYVPAEPAYVQAEPAYAPAAPLSQPVFDQIIFPDDEEAYDPDQVATAFDPTPAHNPTPLASATAVVEPSFFPAAAEVAEVAAAPAAPVAPAVPAAPVATSEPFLPPAAFEFDPDPAPLAPISSSPASSSPSSSPSVGTALAPYEPASDEWTSRSELSTEPWGSAQTVAIWFFVLSPVWLAVIAGSALYLVPSLIQSRPLSIGASIGIFCLLFLLAFADASKLKYNGYDRTASPGWVIIPLLYLIMRTVKIGRKSVAPLIVYILLQVGLFSVAVVILLAYVAALGPGVL
jgi:hypothetical protein